jgi:hypothetical protein
MRRTESNPLKWPSAMVITALLVVAAASIATMASGCGPNDVIIHDCPDSGARDGGGGQGGGGAGGSFCK